jgi:hypothetical protein
MVATPILMVLHANGVWGCPNRYLSEALDMLTQHSMPSLERRIAETRHDLEHGRVEGFPGSVVLHGKLTFATFGGSYRIVFEQAERLGAL